MIYTVSDLHGYPLGSFLRGLRRAGFGHNDTLFVLGDVIDRNGDGGVGILRWMMGKPNVHFILGNHEAMLLSCRFMLDEITENSLDELGEEKIMLLSNYIANGGGETLSALKKLSREEQNRIIAFIEKAPLYEKVSAGGRDYLLVHSGLDNFSPEKKLSDYCDDDLLWARPELDTKYYDDVITVFGHTPTLALKKESAGRLIRTETWINIDAGAGYGFAPVLFRLDDQKEFTLDSKRIRRNLKTR